MMNLGAFLKAHRERLNQRFRIRWLEKRSISGDDFLREYKHLAEAFIGALTSLQNDAATGRSIQTPEVGPENQISDSKIETTLFELYDLVLDLQGHRLWNEDASLRDIPGLIFASFPRLSANHCDEFLSRAINVGFNLKKSSIEVQRWWTLLKRFAPMDSQYSREKASRERFFRLMGALGWLAGLSQFRLSALSVLDSMSEEEGRALFPSVKSPESLRRWLVEMQDNPWAGLADPSPIVLGGFRAFGYQFRNPPRILGADNSGGLLLRDSHQTYLVFADRFGAQIVGLGSDGQAGSTEENPGPLAELDGAALKECISAIKKADLPLPEKFHGSHSHLKTRFLVSEDSYFIWVIPR
ncbi:MAG: hypothetical protein KDK23_02245 [Leptospiraceae bacterium]|nr:hypothetical protein [Leptospiraceae bacterium]